MERIETQLPAPHGAVTTISQYPASLQGLLLARLGRLLRIRFEHEESLNSDGIRLLDRAIFATFCDCRDAGASTEALTIVDRARRALAEAPRAQ